jgi:hypothetical protein
MSDELTVARASCTIASPFARGRALCRTSVASQVRSWLVTGLIATLAALSSAAAAPGQDGWVEDLVSAVVRVKT